MNTDSSARGATTRATADDAGQAPTAPSAGRRARGDCEEAVTRPVDIGRKPQVVTQETYFPCYTHLHLRHIDGTCQYDSFCGETTPADSSCATPDRIATNRIAVCFSGRLVRVRLPASPTARLSTTIDCAYRLTSGRGGFVVYSAVWKLNEFSTEFERIFPTTTAPPVRSLGLARATVPR